MRRWFWGIFVVVIIAGIAAAYYVLFTPKIGSASRAEIEAILPASLKGNDQPDAEGEKRYASLVELAHKLNGKPLNTFANPPDPMADRALPENEAILDQVDTILGQGALRTPARTRDMLLPELSKLKNIAKLIAVSTKAAQVRKDYAACEHWATLGIRFATAMRKSGGVVIDQLVDTADESIALRAIYLAELKDGFDAHGRATMLSLLTPRDGTSVELADAIGRDFQVFWNDLLFNPKTHAKELMESSFVSDESDEDRAYVPPPAGTYDPLATAKLVGGIYGAIVADILRPFPQATHAEGPLLTAAEKGLPVTSTSRGIEGMWYRMRMNMGSNTLGRLGAVNNSLFALTDSVARTSANQNLIRAVFLLRMGKKMDVIDPYSMRLLRFDPKRKLVWSVGKNGTDDGGAIEKGFQDNALDLGYPYGDNSWEPLHPVYKPSSKGFGPPGLPGPGFGSTPPPGASD